jgi:hypothetical protein
MAWMNSVRRWKWLVQGPADENDWVGEGAETGDIDGHHVARLEAERLVGHDARPGQQDGASREREGGGQPAGQLLEPADEIGGTGRPGERDVAPRSTRQKMSKGGAGAAQTGTIPGPSAQDRS